MTIAPVSDSVKQAWCTAETGQVKKRPTSLLVESRQAQDGEGHLCKAVKHEHDEGEEDHAEVELALGEGVGVQLGAQEEGGRDHRHEHGQEEAEDVEEGVPLHQHKLSLHQETEQCERSCKLVPHQQHELSVRQKTKIVSREEPHVAMSANLGTVHSTEPQTDVTLTCQHAWKSAPLLSAYFFLISRALVSPCFSRAALSTPCDRRAVVS